ncbi:MAG: hypothetical protein J0I21_03665 [Alphaproteobacteria bacterium]|nr:hypothetical protein [Alphaproteobacteria bacterium]
MKRGGYLQGLAQAAAGGGFAAPTLMPSRTLFRPGPPPLPPDRMPALAAVPEPHPAVAPPSFPHLSAPRQPAAIPPAHAPLAPSPVAAN